MTLTYIVQNNLPHKQLKPHFSKEAIFSFPSWWGFSRRAGKIRPGEHLASCCLYLAFFKVWCVQHCWCDTQLLDFLSGVGQRAQSGAIPETPGSPYVTTPLLTDWLLEWRWQIRVPAATDAQAGGITQVSRIEHTSSPQSSEYSPVLCGGYLGCELGQHRGFQEWKLVILLAKIVP